MYERYAARKLEIARRDTPVIMLAGARQTGKSTLARQAAQTQPGERIGNKPVPSVKDVPGYFTLDEANARAQATADPQGFLESRRGENWTVLDEVQRAPDLLIAVKHDIDLNRRPGRYLLTGSADVLAIPNVAESLAGRIEIIPMHPLAQCEIEGTPPAFLSHAFSPTLPQWRTKESRTEILHRALVGGYPEALQRTDDARRIAWFGNYILTVIAREVREISHIEDESAITRLLHALASRSGGPLALRSLSMDAKVPETTLRRYLALLRATFLIAELPPWFSNLDARIIKAPKALLNDSGLHAYALGTTLADENVGSLLETFVGAELQKLIGMHEYPHTLMHFRRREREVDFVIEAGDRRIVGCEVKASSSVNAKDFTGLRTLAELAGKKFARGIVFYCGQETLSFGKDLWAVPIPALWAT